MWGKRLSQDHMAAGLMIELVAKFLKCLRGIPSGNHGQSSQRATSMNSSEIEGGIGSLCFFRLSK